MEDLRTRCAFFYEVALRLAALAPMDGLGKLVTAAFRARYKVGEVACGASACLSMPAPADKASCNITYRTAAAGPSRVAYDLQEGF